MYLTIAEPSKDTSTGVGVHVAMVQYRVTGLQITWTSTADGGAAGRRHLGRSCHVGAPPLAPIGWRPGLGRLTLKGSLAKPSDGIL